MGEGKIDAVNPPGFEDEVDAVVLEARERLADRGRKRRDLYDISAVAVIKLDNPGASLKGEKNVLVVFGPLDILDRSGETSYLEGRVFCSDRLGIPRHGEIGGDFVIREKEEFFSVIGKLHSFDAIFCERLKNRLCV